MIFVFQAVFFNLFLSGSVILAKIEAKDDLVATKQTILSQTKYKKLLWLSESEFTFKGYLFDVKEVKQVGNNILISYKIDLKEKSFLERLIEHFKQSKNKKTPQTSFVYKISEPYEMNFIAQITTLDRENILASICGIPQEKNSPPPKI